MARSNDIEDTVKFYVDILIDVYKKTDPKLGEESEFDKLEMAYYAINVWWKLYSELMIWAQSQILGFSICSEEPEFLDKVEAYFGKSLSEDSHDMEHIGMGWVLNRPVASAELIKYDEFFEKFEEEDAEFDFGMTSSFRKFIAEILMSTSVNSSFWRMELQHSLLALNHGEVDILATPANVKKQGRPYLLRRWKWKAIIHVNYLIGRGYKKYRALEEVADGIGQSTETIRSWEKDLKTDFDCRFDFACAELAGLHADELTTNNANQLYDYIAELGTNRGTTPIVNAEYMLSIIKSTPYEKIKKNLRKYRDKQVGN